MKHYEVSWSMEFCAESPEDAARQALAIHRHPDSVETVFNVCEPGEDGEEVQFHSQWLLRGWPEI